MTVRKPRLRTVAKPLISNHELAKAFEGLLRLRLLVVNSMLAKIGRGA